MDMDGPKLQRALFINVIALLLTSDPAISDGTSSCTHDCAPFVPGVVAYWPMVAETKGSDMSGNGNHATFVGLTYTDGPTGEHLGAVNFHGNNASYAWVIKSTALEIGQYPGFAFCGFVRFLKLNTKIAALIDWSDVDKGMFIAGTKSQYLVLNMDTRNDTIKESASFLNMKSSIGSWRFFGVSYDRVTGRVTGFMDGMHAIKQIDKDIVAETAMTSKVGLGMDLRQQDYTYNGDMSCMMLFKVALTAVDFERVWNFCRKRTSTQITLPNIAVSDITATMATASWTESPGTFRRYSITIERQGSQGSGLGQEIAYPQSLDSSVRLPRVTMVNLVPGATYRVHVWHMMGAIKGRARSSPWFYTQPEVLVQSESITLTMITATTANVTWAEGIGVFDAYYVDIYPTTGGAKVNPSTVPRRTTTTSLYNLSPASYYTITIRTKIGSGPSVKSFQTAALNNTIKTPSSTEESLQITVDPIKADPPAFPTIAYIALIAAGICLVLMFVFTILIVTLFKRIISSLSDNNRVDRQLPMSNLGVQLGEEEEICVHGEYDGYEVPDRRKNVSREMPQQAIGVNNETSPGPIYEDLNNSGRG